MAGRLETRLARLQQRWPKPDEWRELLVQRFAAPLYDGQREQIIAALLSDRPHYHFTTEMGGRTAHVTIGWWARDEPPYVKLICHGV
jgi:hypothetical protein